MKQGFVPLRSFLAEWDRVDQDILNEVETEFDDKLSRKSQDDCFSAKERDKRFKQQNSKDCDVVHSLSYNRSIAYISRIDTKQLYNGSSFNRKDPVIRDKYEEAVLDEYAQAELDYKKYRPNVGLNFYQFDSIGSKLTEFEDAPIQQKKDNSKHSTSKRTKDKIKDKMLAFYRSCSGRKGYRKGIVNFTFCTLTFVAPVDDQQGVDCLNSFLTVMRQRYGIHSKVNYIWVAERQGNGNIHFHIIFDGRYPIAYINSLWVSQQFKQGIRNWESDLALNEDHRTTFENLHTEGKYHIVQDYLNPVDIKSVKTIDGISCYLTNYVTKNEGEFECAAWHCSRTVSRLFTSKIVDKKVFDKTGDKSRNMIVSKKTGQLYTNETYCGQYCTINNIYNKSYYRRYLDDLELINKYIVELGDRITKDEIQKVIAIDNQEYRHRFMSDWMSKN